MEPKRPRPRTERSSKSPDDRKAPVNNNYSLLIIVAVVCLVLSAIFFTSGAQVVLKYGRLKELHRPGQPGTEQGCPHRRQGNARRAGGDGPLLEPEQRSGGPQRNNRQGQPGNSLPGGPASGQNRRGVQLFTHGLDQDTKPLLDLLDANGFRNYEGGTPPSAWKSSLLLIALIGGTC